MNNLGYKTKRYLDEKLCSSLYSVFLENIMNLSVYNKIGRIMQNEDQRIITEHIMEEFDG